MSLAARAILVITVIFSCIWSATIAQEDSGADKSRAADAVYLNDEQLFTIKADSGKYSARQRAAAINKRLNKLLSDPDFDPAKIEVLGTESGIDIVAGDIILSTITEADASAAGLSARELAKERKRILESALTEEIAARTLKSAIKEATPVNIAQTMQLLVFHPTTLKFITVFVGALIISLLVKIAQKSIGKYLRDSSSHYATRKIITFVGYLAVLLLAVVVFRDALGNLAVIIGAATAGIAFALKEVIVSLAGWVALSFGDFYKVGDRIQLGGIKGDVIDIGFARTTLMELGEWVKGDNYTGRIVRVANSFIFSQPMFNYSRDFPFLWDEITIPVKYGSDYKLANRILEKIVNDVTADYGQEAQLHWSNVSRKYLVENAHTSPMITLILNDNWVEFTIRYTVDCRKRRSTKDRLFRSILEELEKTNGKVGLASATFELVEAPVIGVKLQNGFENHGTAKGNAAH